MGNGTGKGIQTFFVAAIHVATPNLAAYLSFLRYRSGMCTRCPFASSTRQMEINKFTSSSARVNLATDIEVIDALAIADATYC